MIVRRVPPPRVLVALLGIPFSGILLWLAVRDADLAAVWRSLADARPGPLAAAVALLAVVYALQAERWRRIADSSVGLPRFYEMVLGGLACNNVLPVRIGELLRARWLGRAAGIPGGRALGTVAIDRGCDIVGLAIFLGVGIAAVATAQWLVRIAVSALAAIVVFGAALAFARLYTRRRRRDRHGRGRVRRIARDTIEMLAEPIGRRRAAAWIALSLGAWAVWAGVLIFVARSLDVDLGLLDALFVTAVLNLGAGLPSSPGYVGTYQWLGVASLGLLDVPVNEALALSILLHATWYVPTTLVGGAFVAVRIYREAPLAGSR